MTTGFKTVMLILILTGMIVLGNCGLTFPLYHTQSREYHAGLPESHQASYVIHHNMRNLHTNHLRHELHMSESAQTYGIISMGYFFTLPLKIAGMNYNLNVDTGSSDIFIKGEHSKGSPPHKYSCPECLRNNPQYSIGYVDGFLQTYLKRLPVEIGQHKFDEDILVAFTAPKNFQKPQGLVGLSFPSLAVNPSPNFIQTLINNKIIDKYSFGVNLNFQNNRTSAITFGEPSQEHYEGELKKSKIMQGNSYRIRIDSIQVAKGPHMSVSVGLLDTGNSCISIPKRFDTFILNQFNNAGVGYNKCAYDNQPFNRMFSLLRCRVSDFDRLPVVSIYIDGTRFQLDKDAYIQRCVWEGSDSLCDLYIESSGFGSEVLIGDGFFNRYYTYFDLENREIGFAKNKQKLSYKHMYKPHSALDSEDKTFFANLKIKK